MGTPEGERDWVDVANDLLRKCQINLRLAKLADCNANVFIAFYEKILGEKVPDYIAKPCSQEDDFHNVQSVIDSLALDYLQISLSHITGENIVRGDKESIKNLLEIFDGLLEYLNEETSEEFHNGDFDRTLAEFVPRGVEPQGPEQTDATLEADSLSSSAHSAIQSSKHSLHSWNAEEIGSTNELIGLGDSARTFTAKQDAGDLTHPQALPFVEPLLIPIPQQPPYQTTTHHRGDTTPCQPGLPPKSSRLSQGHSEQEAAPAATENSKQPAESSLSNGLQYPNQHSTPALSENSDSSLQRTRTAEERETLEPTYGGPRTILFRTQTDLLPSLQDGLEHKATSPSDTEEEEVEVEVEDLSANLRQEDGRIAPRERKAHGRFSEEKCEEDPLSRQRQKNLETEQELHHMSVKMSRRLEELGKMLKRALVESGESSEVREEDNECQHNDSIVDSRPHKDTPRPEAECRPHPTLPTSPRACPSLQEQLEGTARGEWGQETGLERGVKTRRQTNLSDGSSVHRTRRQELHPRPSRRKSNKQVNVAYEEELKRFEDRERTNLAMERLRAQEAEREYREAILSGVPRAARPSPAKKTTLQPWPVHARPVTARRRQDHPRKAPPMKVKEKDLLPVLLEELPHLHISAHSLGRMWEQQLEQVDRLHAISASQQQQHHTKRSSQVEDTKRRHDLLVEIICKEQEHNKRLRDFKERIQQQKSAQNRLKEQRQQIARAKKYHSDYHVQHRARMMRARTKEERMFRQVFEEGLALQKARLQEQRAFAREQRLEHQRHHQDQIKSMENYYRDQFSLLAETLAQEREEIQVRKNAQEKALQKMKRELRCRMEREIGELQRIIVQNDDDDFFQELEVGRLRGRVQMASFQYGRGALR